MMYFATKFLCTAVRERVAGSDYFPKFYMHYANDLYVTIFLMGAKPSIAELAVARNNDKVGHDIIVGTDSTAFEFDSDKAEIERMVAAANDSGATVCVVGLAGGRQEKFILRYRDRMPGVQLWLPFGGTIDYESGTFA